MRILAVSLITAVFVATVGLGWLFDYLFQQYAQDDASMPLNSTTAIEKFGSDIQFFLEQGDRTQLELASLVSQWPSNGSYQLNLLPIKSLSLPEDIKQQLLAGKPLTLASEDDVTIYYYLEKHQQLLSLSSPFINPQPPANVNRYLFTSLFYLALLSLMLLWLYPLIKRLLALRAMTTKFGQGQLDQRIKVGSISYIRDLEIDFNHMAQRISDLVADVKLLSSAVSHDLRTPLATIRFGIDTLQDEDDPKMRQIFIQRISDNVDEMIELVEVLLNYARLDQNLITLNKSHINLTPLVKQIIKQHQNEQLTIELIEDTQQDLRVFADKQYLSMLLKNLIKNATQHCHRRIKIGIYGENERVMITISDDGEGIAASQRQQIIKPFVRGKAEHKGYGVGLAIVQRVLHWHNGSLTISEDEELGGAKFIVALPSIAKNK